MDDLLIYMDALGFAPTLLEALIERVKNGKGARPEPTAEVPALQ